MSPSSQVQFCHDGVNLHSETDPFSINLESIDNPGLEHSDFLHYQQLFDFHDNLYCGEITPGYRRLSSKYIQEIASHFSKTRFILMVRSPIERSVSSIKKRYSKGIISLREIDMRMNDNDRDNLQTILNPVPIYNKWMQSVGREKLLAIKLVSQTNGAKIK